MKTTHWVILIAVLLVWQACQPKGRNSESSNMVKQDSTHAWWKEAVVYEVYPRSFKDSNGDGIGDLKGVEQKLDYLKALGVNVIWLCPIYSSPNVDNGYDISDYYHIMKDFGTMADFDSLLAGVHKRDMKLIMDLVVNHTSDQHRWFKESRKSKNNPYRDFYFWRNPGPNGGPPNNWVSYFGGSAWQFDKTTEQYYLHLFAVEQPDLNWDNPAVRDSVFKMMHYWLDKGIDGFRMDVVSLYSKKKGLPDFPKNFDGNFAHFYANGPHEQEYLKGMYHKVLSHYDVMTVGEASGVHLDEAHLYVAPERHELDMIFQFELMGIDHKPGPDYSLPKKWTLPEFKKVFIRWDSALTARGEGWNSVFLGNHDNPRVVSRFGNDKEYRVPSAKLFATLLMTMRGTPYIYEGDELGMTNAPFKTIHDFRDVATINRYNEIKAKGGDLEAFLANQREFGRDNSRTPMQWNDQENAGFSTGKPWIMVNPNYKTINAAAEEADSESVLNYYKRIIHFRHEHPTMVYGDFKVIDRSNPDVFAYIRGEGNDRYLVLLNMSNNPVDFALPESVSRKSWNLMIDNYEDGQSQSGSSIKMKPWESMVYGEK
ncbi:MAG TPA: alpha-glucosidase [Balneolales bacterium]|nr:alpha-glucosidase [Balneolales bacterium]